MYLVLAKSHDMFNITSVSSKTKILQSQYTSITQYIFQRDQSITNKCGYIQSLGRDNCSISQ